MMKASRERENDKSTEEKLVKTRAVFFPFDLFGSGGAAAGAELVADAFQEMLDDNRRERIPTRARAYQNHVRVESFAFPRLSSYQDWKNQARKVIRQALKRGEFLLWITGNHLGVLPVYEELVSGRKRHPNTLVIQFDAHLDVYNLSDCTAELSHGNFLLHCAGPLPAIVNVGARELLLRPDYVRKYYQHVFPAADLAVDSQPAEQTIRQAVAQADRVFIDLDCDVLDPAYFPAVSHPLPFGLPPSLLLRLVDAAWSERLIGVAVSEFDPARDHNDQSLSTLVWLLEYLLLKKYEAKL